MRSGSVEEPERWVHTSLDGWPANGAEHLLLVSRRGPDAPGAAELAVENHRTRRHRKCDYLRRDGSTGGTETPRPGGSVPPLTAVFHTAGVLDDGIIESLTPARIGPVLCSKAHAAAVLQKLTAHQELSAIVLFYLVRRHLGGRRTSQLHRPLMPTSTQWPSSAGSMDLLRRQSRGAAWAGSGMADEPVTELLRRGVTAMAPEHAITVLAVAVRSNGHPASRFAHLLFQAEAMLAGRRRLARRGGGRKLAGCKG